MAGTMSITNPKRKGKGRKRGKARTNPRRKGSRTRRRNPRGFGGSIVKGFVADGKLALVNLGGRYGAETLAVAGDKVLGGTLGDMAGIAAQLGGYYALRKFGKANASYQQARIGLLSEVAHEALTDMAGIDVPAMVVDVFAPAATAAPAATEGTSGVGLISRTALSTKLAGHGNPYMTAYTRPY